MGAPLFLRLYSMLNHGRNSEYFKFIYLSWRKLPGLKRVWIQQVEDFGCLDVNLRVWNASKFNKSKTCGKNGKHICVLPLIILMTKTMWRLWSLFEECSRCSLLHIQTICVKRYMKCLYFSLKLIGLPGCSSRFWKSKN